MTIWQTIQDPFFPVFVLFVVCLIGFTLGVLALLVRHGGRV